MTNSYLDLIDKSLLKEKKALIQKYVAEHPEPESTFCPDVCICYKVKGATKLVNLLTGGVTDYPESFDISAVRQKETGYWNIKTPSNALVISPTKTIKAVYARIVYPENKNDAKGIELAVISIDGNRKGETNRKWKYTFERCFFFKDSKAVYDINGNVDMYSNGTLYSKDFTAWLKAAYKNKPNIKANEGIKLFVGDTVKERNDVAPALLGFFFFMSWYKDYIPPTQQNPDNHFNIINNLPPVDTKELKIKAPMISFEAKNVFNKNYHKEWKDIVYIFSIVNPHVAVIREFRGGYARTEYQETYRYLITDKKEVKVYCHRYYWSKDWKNINNNNFLNATDDRCYFFGFEKAKDFPAFGKVFGTKINYLTYNTVTSALVCIKHPIFEQLIKAGYPDITAKLSRSYPYINSSFSSVLDTNYSSSSKKSFYQIIGLNKYQLTQIENLKNTSKYDWINDSLIGNTLRNMKLILGLERLSSLTNKDWDEYFQMFLNFTYVVPWIGTIIYQIDEENNLYHLTRKTNGGISFIPSEKLLKKIRKLICRMWKWSEKTSLEEKITRENLYAILVRTFKDSMNMLIDMSKTNRPNIDLYDIRSENELHRVHDTLIELSNMDKLAKKKEENEKLDKKIKELTEEREKNFSEEDEEFSIVIPKHANEILEEGMKLHHCVGSYVNRYASGDTNILFLRKKKDITAPFYTIEVDSNNRITQIHGKYNEWLGNNPETIPFMIKWIRSKGLKCKANLLLNQSSGYSAGNKHLNGKIYGLEVNDNV